MNEKMQGTLNNTIVKEDLAILSNDSLIPWSQLRNKTVVITGASGFLPAYMVEILLLLNKEKSLNVKIIAIVRDLKKFSQRFHHYNDRSDLICLEKDVCSNLNLKQNIDYIIHAASHASPKFYSKDPVGTLSANSIGTAKLLELAQNNQAEGFLYFSSSEVYGEPTVIPTSESDYGYIDPLDIRSCYAESKRMGENMCVSWNHQFGIPVKIVRPFHTYGPGMKLNDGRVYADFVSDVINSRDIILKSDGLAKRSFCYVADAIKGFWLVLLCGENRKAYNVGNPSGEISMRDLALLISGLYPEKQIAVKYETREEFDNYLPSKVPITCPDITLIKKLGWEPTTSIECGFRRTIESYRV